MTTGERIKERRKELGYSADKLAELMNIDRSTIFRYERGDIEKMPTEVLKELAEILNVSPLYLMGLTDEKHPSIYDNVELPTNAVPVPPQCQVAVIGRVSAGNGVYAYDDVLGYEFADERYCNNDYFYLKVVGDSMTPEIKDGDLVLVHKQPSIDSGNYGVVLVDDEEGCVKIVKYGKDWIELHSVNPYYPVRRFTGAEVQMIKVVGKVIEIKRKL